MKAVATLFLTWLLCGICAAVGSMLGHAFPRPGLFVGGILGGLAGVYASVRLTGWLGWVAPSEEAGALLGGVLAFGVAAVIAVSTIHTPVGPVASGALVGAGVLLGAGASRAW
jgi:hypothetical protein